MIPDNLYNTLIEKYKNDPQGILDEYKENYQGQERFIKYSKIVWWVIAFAIIGSFGNSYHWIISYPIAIRLLLGITIGTIYVILIFTLTKIIDKYPKEFPDYKIIKSIYKDAYSRLTKTF